MRRVLVKERLARAGPSRSVAQRIREFVGESRRSIMPELATTAAYLPDVAHRPARFDVVSVAKRPGTLGECLRRRKRTNARASC